MQIIDTLEQGTPEWHQARCGIITMSCLQSVMSTGRQEGGFGVGAISYMFELIGERFTGSVDIAPAGYHARRGHELEPVVCAGYEEITGSKVDHVGIILNHGVGYSPDGLVGSDGLIEIKTKLPKLQAEVLFTDEVPKEHIDQLQGGLWVSDREWIDFISYSEGMPTFMKRVYRDEEYIRKIATRVKAFYQIMERRIETIIKNSVEI